MPSMQQTVQPDGLRCRRDPESVQVSAARPCGASGHVGVWKQKNRSKTGVRGEHSGKVCSVVGCGVCEKRCAQNGAKRHV